MGAKSESREGTRITLVGIHTNQGPNPSDVFPDRTAENLAAYMDQPGIEVSYHVLVDDDSKVDYLPDNVAAWSMLSANHRSLNLCFTGMAEWDRAEWLRHDAMLRRGADVVRDWCVRYAIPMVHLTPAQVGADYPGVIGHADWTTGKRQGTHWDPGPAFVWDIFMGYVNGNTPPPPPPPPPGADSIPTMTFGERSTNVLHLQQYMTRIFRSYNAYEPTGFYGNSTKAGIAEFQHRTGVTGPDANGEIVGPRTKVQLWRYGYRP